MEIGVDKSAWPIVRVTWPAEITTRDVSRLGSLLTEIHRTLGPMVLVADIEGLSALAVTPLLRKSIADEADKLAQQGAILAEAVIVRNPLLRGIHRAYTWARARQDYPTATFANVTAATDWANELLPPR